MVVAFSTSIVKDTGPLSEEFLPPHFPARKAQLQAIIDHLTPVSSGGRPGHVWVHGPPGSGKSSCVREALAQLEERGIKTAYVNCWSSQTFYAVMETIFQELRALVAEMRDVSFKFERLSRIARDRPLIIVLDEIDQMFQRERNAALYNLSRLNGAGLVCVSQSRETYLSLDNRVRSRIDPQFIEFSSYTIDQLVAILEARASSSLDASAWCKPDLAAIADRSAGDARVAIQTLRTAAYRADRSRVGQITRQDIDHGLETSSHLRRRYTLKKLSEHHRLIYQVVMKAGRISSVALWKEYLKAARERGLEPMARRTFTYYKQQLVANRILKERSGRGRSNLRIVEAVE